MVKNSQTVPFDQILDALLDVDNPFPAYYLHRFSDINQSHLAELTKVWTVIPLSRKKSFLEDLEILLETDTLVKFDDVAYLALEDKDPNVRDLGIRLLWENEEKRFSTILLKILQTDTSPLVRERAALSLGKFVYLGELEEIPLSIYQEVEELLLKAVRTENSKAVRQRALEALGYSSREEVQALIEEAFQSKDQSWIAVALAAMGHSADNRWEGAVSSMLYHMNDTIRLEAIKAAGELELKSTREVLLQLLEEELDPDLATATIWSLSQIGGQGVREAIEAKLDSCLDDEEEEFLEEALENLSFNEDFGLLGMFEVDDDSNDNETNKDEYRSKRVK